MVINDVSKLDSIQDIIHDRWFDLEKIEFNKTMQTLSIPVEGKILGKTKIIKKIFFLKKWECELKELIIIIYNVLSFKIEDTEKIGKYDFNNIEILDDNKIKINTNIPLIFFAIVKNLKIEIKEVSKEVVYKIMI